jgi:hypothetical protein
MVPLRFSMLRNSGRGHRSLEALNLGMNQECWIGEARLNKTDVLLIAWLFGMALGSFGEQP